MDMFDEALTVHTTGIQQTVFISDLLRQMGIYYDCKTTITAPFSGKASIVIPFPHSEIVKIFIKRKYPSLI